MIVRDEAAIIESRYLVPANHAENSYCMECAEYIIIKSNSCDTGHRFYVSAGMIIYILMPSLD
jgi:hypothetical protein